jgi:hypothetical protein
MDGKMNISLNTSVFLYIAVLLLGTFTCAVYSIKAVFEKQSLYKTTGTLIGAFLLYSGFEFLLGYFADNAKNRWVFHACVALSDIAYFILVIFWLFLLGILSRNQYLIRKKPLVAVTAVYGVAAETLVILALRGGTLTSEPRALDMAEANGFPPIALLNFAFSVFLLIRGSKCILYGILKMRGEATRKPMLLFSGIFIVYVMWVAYWDYSITARSAENLLRFDPILIVFFIVCLISLRILYKNDILSWGGGEKNTSSQAPEYLMRIVCGELFVKNIN